MLYELHFHDTSGKSGIQAAVVRSRTPFGPMSTGDILVGSFPLSSGVHYTIFRIEHSFPSMVATWELEDTPPIEDQDDDLVEDPANQILVHRLDVYLAP